MKKSIYNIPIESPYGIILFNSFTGALLLLDSDMYNRFLANQLTSSESALFLTNGYYIEDSMDEQALIEYTRSKAVFASKNHIYRIFTTTACNARCPYCYEDKTTPSFMSEKTADALISFILNHSVGSDTIYLHWFGGEPLLNWKIIDYITSHLQKFSDFHLHQTITSNSSLWNDSLIHLAKDKWGLNRVQVTLDGFRSTHNQIKLYTDRTDGFQDTIDNIHKLLDAKIFVDIRLNVDKSNFKSVLDLLYYLNKEFSDRQYLRVYPYPVFNSNVDDICISRENQNLIDAENCEHYLFPISDAINDLHFSTISHRNRCQKAVSCGAVKEGNFVIDPNGLLYKCSFEVSCPKNAVGDVFTGIRMNTNYAKWALPSYSDECLRCSYLPLCQGGCKYQTIHNQTHYCGVTKSLLKHDLIRQVMKYDLKGGSK